MQPYWLHFAYCFCYKMTTFVVQLLIHPPYFNGGGKLLIINVLYNKTLRI